MLALRINTRSLFQFFVNKFIIQPNCELRLWFRPIEIANSLFVLSVHTDAMLFVLERRRLLLLQKIFALIVAFYDVRLRRVWIYDVVVVWSRNLKLFDRIEIPYGSRAKRNVSFVPRNLLLSIG